MKNNYLITFSSSTIFCSSDNKDYACVNLTSEYFFDAIILPPFPYNICTVKNHKYNFRYLFDYTILL